MEDINRESILELKKEIIDKYVDKEDIEKDKIKIEEESKELFDTFNTSNTKLEDELDLYE